MPAKERITITLDVDVLEAARQEAEAQRMTLSAYINGRLAWALRNKLKSQDGE